MARIPVGSADVSGNEEKYVADAVRSSWISSSGPYVQRFEREYAELCGTTAAIGVCNGTAALHLALLALDVRRGDEVLVPSLTYVATANACRYVGAEPVFVEVDPDTWCMDPRKLEVALTPRTRGIIPVHLYGHPADMDRINEFAALHKLWVLEDAAEAHLARYRDRPVGGLGSLAVFSFYGNKIFTSGEGGAITLSNPELESRTRTLRNQGVDPNRRYYFPITGYNFRLTNVACALLCAQLERREQMVARRREIYAQYTGRLKNVSGIGFQPVAPWAVVSPWMFCITVDPRAYGHTCAELMSILDRHEIETRPFFTPLHRLPMFRDESAKRGDDLPITDRLAESGMNLPTYSQLATADVDRICEIIRTNRR